MKREFMRYGNDCSVASVAMATGVPYSKVLAKAREKGFKPNARWGCNFYQLLHHLDRLGEVQIIRMLGDFPKRLKVQGTHVVSIPSLNNRGKGHLHAVVVHKGRVFDPSRRRRATMARVRATVRNGASVRND